MAIHIRNTYCCCIVGLKKCKTKCKQTTGVFNYFKTQRTNYRYILLFQNTAMGLFLLKIIAKVFLWSNWSSEKETIQISYWEKDTLVAVTSPDVLHRALFQISLVFLISKVF